MKVTAGLFALSIFGVLIGETGADSRRFLRSNEVDSEHENVKPSGRRILNRTLVHSNPRMLQNRTRILSDRTRILQTNRTRILQTNRTRILQTNRTRILSDRTRILQTNRTRILSNRTRVLGEIKNTKEGIAKGDNIEEVIAEEEIDYCARVKEGYDATDEATWEFCKEFDELPYLGLDCKEKDAVVPKILHTVGKDESEHFLQTMTSAANPMYVRNHHGDESAAEFVQEHCGDIYEQAYRCLNAPAYRADLFRFCALYAQGGVYLDSDIVPLFPLEELYSPCASATVGHDLPLGEIGESKQMKILAGAPGASLFKCAMEKILQNIERHAAHPETSLHVSGPQLLQECYEENHEDVAISYHDTHAARWPYTGLRQGEKVLAIEIPSSKHFGHKGGYSAKRDYNTFFLEGKSFTDTCPLLPSFSFPPVEKRVEHYLAMSVDMLLDETDVCKLMTTSPEDYFSSMEEVVALDMPEWKLDIKKWKNKEDTLSGSKLGVAEALRHKFLYVANEDMRDLQWMLYSKSVVFMSEPSLSSWMMEDNLVPWYHYIPVKEDLSDLEDKLHWARTHDMDAWRISQQATEYMKDIWFSASGKSATMKVAMEVNAKIIGFGLTLDGCTGQAQA